MTALNGPCNEHKGKRDMGCGWCRADDAAVQAGLAEIGRGIDAVLGRERRLRKTLAALVEYLDYSGDLAQTRDEACNCPLDENDTQCGICLGRDALAKARELLR
jgi:hypothetical protein